MNGVVWGRVAQSSRVVILMLGIVAGLLTAAPSLGGQEAGVVTAFPAAGTLMVHGVRVRAQSDPQARVLRLMRQFRRDFRPQEIFAVRSQTGSDGQP